MKTASAAVLIPTYNEAGNIRELLDEVLHLFDEEGVEGFIMIIDDGSPDGTAGIVAEYAARDGRVRLLNRGRKMGIGSAYRDGFRLLLGGETGVEVAVTMDADRSHGPEIMLELLRKISEGYDVVIASRYVRGGRWSAGFVRKIISRGANILARLATGLGVRDLTSGYRAYRVEHLKNLDLERLERGYVFQVQVLYELSRYGVKVAEIPLVFRSRAAGASKLTPGEMASFFKWCVKTLLRRLI
ncbi:MAG TPA: polyprenol monophosphomannose synthase [Candidatus Caldiarchaeum subterraneum]|uniref:Polyprenol monophosphomannose synthase n=1 Tax=Caldiarchaeum subterraneum TaxID=311458 RepID=A0A832ZVU3_CALS0|nr:polyprenol monophosphomannose synthase [Candidatus Caldarchaeum subterraneum]